MRLLMSLVAVSYLTALAAITAPISTAQESASSASTAAIKTVEVTPATQDISVGQKVKFTVVAKDPAGNIVNATPSTWLAAPFDLAGVDDSGTVSFFAPGEVLVGAIVAGQPNFIT